MWQTLNSTLPTYSAAAQYNPARPLRVWSSFLPTGRVAMYDVHYLCRASYDSGYSCPPRMSSVFCNCVKLSVVLTTSLSFRSNVNYIPPPQEVSFPFFFSWSSFYIFFFVFFLVISLVIWAKHWLNLSTWKLILMCFWLESQSQIAITLDTQYLHNTVCLFISPRILNTPSHLCSEKLAFHQESIARETRCQHWIFFFLLKWTLELPIPANFSHLPPPIPLDETKFCKASSYSLCCVGLSLSLTFSALMGLSGFMRLCSPLVVRCYTSKWALIQGSAEISTYFAPSFCRPIVLTTFVFFYQRLPI